MLKRLAGVRAARFRRHHASRIEALAKAAVLRLAALSGRPLTPEAKARLKRLAARLSPGIRANMEEGEVRDIRRRMLGFGLLERGEAELRTIAADSGRPFGRRHAALALMAWHLDGGAGGAAGALDFLDGAHRGTRGEQRRRAAVMGAEALRLLGKIEEARRLLAAPAAQATSPDILLGLANLESDAAAKLALLNDGLRAAGLANLRLAAEGGGVFDRLEGVSADVRPIEDGPLISVIVPAFNSAATIRTALASLLAQTWRRIEVIVVDDASTDGTRAVAAALAQADPRIRLLGLEANRGAYAARNAGLRAARGAFVTCHDADDWSHSEKLAFQVRHLLADPGAIANTSTQSRAGGDLTFQMRGNLGFYVQPNLSSLMFRREPVAARLGQWDEVRFGGDSDFLQRLLAAWGKRALTHLASFPLAFQRQAEGSLTTARVSAYGGVLSGARLEYDRAARRHIAKEGGLRFNGARPFAVPTPILPRRGSAKPRFDVIIASDFRLPGGSSASTAEEVKAQTGAGLATGLIHMPVFKLRHDMPFNEKVASLIDGGAVRSVVAGEDVSCGLLIVRHPWVLQDRTRLLPAVEAAAVKVVVNQAPSRSYGGAADEVYDIPTAAAHCRDYFGKEAVWHPIGPLVREALHAHHARDLDAIDLGAEDWPNIIDVAEWRRAPHMVDPAHIRIGRHSRDHPLKWPAERSELLAAYPDRPPFEVHVLGGAEAPAITLGGLPRNWRVTPFGGMPAREFLAGLDVFVYFNHPGWVEAFGRVIMEAMAVGVPAVLPRAYAPLFGEAALYCTPSEVGDVVRRLAGDPAFYQGQVATARDFVAEHFGHARHLARIRPYLASVSSTSDGAA